MAELIEKRAQAQQKNANKKVAIFVNEIFITGP